MNINSLITKSVNELKKAGIKSAPIDVQILLEHAINKSREFTYSHPEYLITNTQYFKFRSYIRRRKKNEPVAYIIGEKEFYGLKLLVNKNTLTPRSETEELVEKAIGFLSTVIPSEVEGSHKKISPPVRQRSRSRNDKINVLDMGTGSGNIIISIAKHLSSPQYSILNTQYFATDISKQAIGVAKKNALLHELDQEIKFYHSDLFSNRLLPKKFDLIIANLPYVPEKDHTTAIRQNEEIIFEPKNAIFAPENGSQTIRNFLELAKNKINDGGVILIELDPRNANSLKLHALKCFSKNWEVTLKKDLSGKNRFLCVCPIEI